VPQTPQPPKRKNLHKRTFTETYRAEQLVNGLASLRLEHQEQLHTLQVQAPAAGRESFERKSPSPSCTATLSAHVPPLVRTTTSSDGGSSAGFRDRRETLLVGDDPSGPALLTAWPDKWESEPMSEDEGGAPTPNALESAIAQERAALREAEENPQPQNLQREAVLGAGGFACVWLAKDAPTRRRFALKQMSKAHVIESNAGNRVLLEKRAHEEMSHPFIVKLFCTFQDADNLYFLLELARGGDLFEALQANGGSFSEDWARFYCGAVALGLRHMHFLGYVYRDLKPENILLDSAGFAKLADMGFAKKTADIRERSFTDLGTELYASPEFVHGKGRTKAADWWSVGVLLHEMITGAPPFTGKDTQELMQCVSDYAMGKRESNQRLRQRLVEEEFVTEQGADLVAGFLEEEETQRLGSTGAGFRAIQSHPWFVPLDWVALLQRQHAPPFVPAATKLGRSVGSDAELLKKRDFDRDHWQPIFEHFGPRVTLMPTWMPSCCVSVGAALRKCRAAWGASSSAPAEKRFVLGSPQWSPAEPHTSPPYFKRNLSRDYAPF